MFRLRIKKPRLSRFFCIRFSPVKDQCTSKKEAKLQNASQINDWRYGGYGCL